MTNPEKVYQVLADHPRGMFADTLAMAADIPRKGISSLVGKAQRYCPRGKRIEGFTTRPRGMTQTLYKIVRDWGVEIGQTELIESGAV